MKKKRILVLLLILTAASLCAQAIPYPVDSREYSDFKQNLIGSPAAEPEAISRQDESQWQALKYEQQSRNGLLIPLDDSFTLAMSGNDDSSSSVIGLPFVFDFYGSMQSQFYINNNGNVSFGNRYSTYSSYGFPLNGYPMLAAFWADVDTRPAAGGDVYYKLEDNRVTVIWNAVGYYGNQIDKLNTFEIIFSDGTCPIIGLGNNVAFSYGDMQWTTGNASGGSGGFGGTPATVGINQGDGASYAQIGRFDHEGTDYHGPHGAYSGVSWLDYQLFTFSAQTMSIPPYFTGVPSEMITLNTGDVHQLNISANSATSDSVNVTVEHDFITGFAYEIIPGNPCYLNIQIDAQLGNLGEHWITLNAVDNNDPPQQASTSFGVSIEAGGSDFLLVANYTPPSLSIVDVATNTVLGPFLEGQLGAQRLLDVVLSSDSQFALVSNFANHTVYHLDLSNILQPAVLSAYQLDFAAEDITLSHDDRYALVADGATATYLGVLDLQSRTLVQNIDISPHQAQGVEISRDGKVLVNDTNGGLVHQYYLDFETGELSYTDVSVSVNSPLNTAIHPSGDYAIACSHSSDSKVLSLHADNSIQIIQSLPQSSQSAIYSKDGSRALIGGANNILSEYAVLADGTLELLYSHTLPYSPSAGFFGVDMIAISSDKSKAYISASTNDEIVPLVSIDLYTHELQQLTLPHPVGICLGNTDLLAFFQADFTYEATNTPSSTEVQFTNLSIGSPDSYLWDFGDGSSSSLENPFHEYFTPGVYNVSLTIFKGAISSTHSMSVTAEFDANVHLSLAGSPYHFNADLIISEASVLSIDEAVVINFAPNAGLKVYGRILADGVTLQGNDAMGWDGILIQSQQLPMLFDNCNIINAITGLKLVDGSFPINNLLISAADELPSQIGLQIVGVCNVGLDGLEVQGYPVGIAFSNSNRLTSSPTLTNIRIRNTGSASRQGSAGLTVTGAVALQIEDAEFDDFDTGVDWDAQSTQFTRATPTLTNIRIRNTGSASRSLAKGVLLKNISRINASNNAIYSTAEQDSISGFSQGFVVDNEEYAGASSNVVLTNIRIRNTGSASRSASRGIYLRNVSQVTAEQDSIAGFSQGFVLDNEQHAAATNVVLTNIRIRNTGSASRAETQGIYLKGVNQLTADQSNIAGCSQGFVLDNEQHAAATNVVLTNIRIRNTGSASRAETQGIYLKGVNQLTADQSNIEGCSQGFVINNQQHASGSNVVITNIRIRNTGSASRQGSQAVLLQNVTNASCAKLMIHPDEQQRHPYRTGQNLAGQAIVVQGGSANISQSTIWGYEKGLKLVAASAEMVRSVIWSGSGVPLTEPIEIESGTATVNQSNISYAAGAYPGVNNSDADPLFADPDSGNFYLLPRSPLRTDDPDAQIGSYPYDFAALEFMMESYDFPFEPGWNMMGMPIIVAPGENTPLNIFGDYLAPFYVHPYYTSILQLNSPEELAIGHLNLNAQNLNVPSVLYPAVGYWLRNPQLETVSVPVYGILDKEDYLMDLESGVQDHFMLANPYDLPISPADSSIVINNVNTYATVFNPDTYGYDVINISTGTGTIPPWRAFFLQASGPNAQVKFSYPGAPRFRSNNVQVAQANPSAHPSELSWEVLLQADSGRYAGKAILGAAADASDAYDPMDVSCLPNMPFAPQAKIDLYIDNSHWSERAGNYLRDIKNNAASVYSWNLMLNLENLLEDGIFEGAVSLGIPQDSKLPQGCSLQLADPGSGQIVNLREDQMILELKIDATNPPIGHSPWLVPLILEVAVNPDGQEEAPDLISTQNYPNPFNPSTTISYSLGKDAMVSLDIYNVKGQLVRSLHKGLQNQGTHKVIWNGKDAQGRDTASGFYFYRLKVGDKKITRKILMLK
ncbi:MAG: T9SS type A sorting domain-containing protein [Candidatus Cloacimonetes bacterium]|nr:T9SS type A sorting domain-containing protein [Candidatus Cloacimonadota bacterium]MCK9178614.1 PKD domain-containing protein [Candidatus Cloacimonadota bacterium]